VNRRRERPKDQDSETDENDTALRDCFYAFEYEFSWQECMLLFFYLMEQNLINPPTVTVTRCTTKHGNEFKYNVSTELPWMIQKILDLEAVVFQERGHIDNETQIMAYTLHNVTTKSGGKYHITEYCEYQRVGDKQTTFRKMVKTECPDWLPDFAVDKACDLYIKSTAKRCKKNVQLLSEGTDQMKQACIPPTLEELGRLGLSFDQPIGALGVNQTASSNTTPRSCVKKLQFLERGDDHQDFFTPKHRETTKGKPDSPGITPAPPEGLDLGQGPLAEAHPALGHDDDSTAARVQLEQDLDVYLSENDEKSISRQHVITQVASTPKHFKTPSSSPVASPKHTPLPASGEGQQL